MTTLQSVTEMKHKNEKPDLSGEGGGEPTPPRSGTRLNFMSYLAAGKAQNEASLKPSFKVT